MVQLKWGFKNCTQFIKSFKKINGATKDAEDLDLIMTVYNLIAHGSNFYETTGSLCFYSKDEATKVNSGNASTNNFKPFKYKLILLGNTEASEASRLLRNKTID